MKSITFTRRELYNLVWETPLHQIALKYDISKADIKSACTKLKVPLPASSYWTSFHVRQQHELEEAFLEKTSIEIMVSGNKKLLRKSARSGPDFDLAVKILNDPDYPLHLSDKLDNPSEILQVERKQEINEECCSQILKLDIAHSNTLRVLIFLDALVKLLNFRGHQVQINALKTGLIFLKDGSNVELSIREGRKKVFYKSSYREWTSEFTGQFIVKVKFGGVQKEMRQINLFKESGLARIAAIIELSRT